MKITKLGHCCLVVEMNNVRFMTDPGNYTTLQNEALNIDAVLISHEHTDHLHVESVKKIIENNPSVVIISNPSVGKILQANNIDYISLASGQKTSIKNIEVLAEGSKHAPIYRDYEQVENTGFWLDKKFFYPGDALYVPGEKVDILAFPVAGPWLTLAQAVDYCIAVKPRIAIPVHDGNLVKTSGLTVRLPQIYLNEAGIKFMPLEINRETDMM